MILIAFSCLGIKLHCTCSVPWGPSAMAGVCSAVLELELQGEAGLLMRTFPDPSLSLSEGFQHAQFQEHIVFFAVPYAAAGSFFHLLTPGHLQEVGKTCASQAIENLLRVGHCPRNPILVAQQGSF